MALQLEYFDASGLSIYGIVFNSLGSALSTGTFGFISYSDASILSFAFPLAEASTRRGRYTATIANTTAIVADDLEVEYWRQISGAPSKSTDFLVSIDTLLFNGSGLADATVPPGLSSPSFAGNPYITNDLKFLTISTDRFGGRADVDSGPNFTVYNGASATSVTGVLSKIDTGTYAGTFNVTGSVFTPGNSYQILITALKDNITVATEKSFSVAAVTGNIDIISILGLTRGTVSGISTVSGIHTTLTLVDNQYNGNSIYVASGALKGHSRIIANSYAANGRLLFDKNTVSAIPTGSIFFLGNLAGELNVS